MGCADYHPNPCVLVCPFATCKKSHRILNGIGAVSQLYSHWQQRHAENPAARKLEARWRLAQSPAGKGQDAAWLDAREARVPLPIARLPLWPCRTTACALPSANVAAAEPLPN